MINLSKHTSKLADSFRWNKLALILGYNLFLVFVFGVCV
jgi:hypothetical protein